MIHLPKTRLVESITCQARWKMHLPPEPSVPVVIATMFAPIAVAVAVPAVVVLAPSVVAIPVTREVPAALITRSNPPRAAINRQRPITGVPLVVISHWIPVALHPNVVRAGAGGQNLDHARRWRRTDLYPDRNLPVGRSCDKHQ